EEREQRHEVAGFALEARDAVPADAEDRDDPRADEAGDGAREADDDREQPTHGRDVSGSPMRTAPVKSVAQKGGATFMRQRPMSIVMAIRPLMAAIPAGVDAKRPALPRGPAAALPSRSAADRSTA